MNKIIVAGGRDFTDDMGLVNILFGYAQPYDEIVTGGCNCKPDDPRVGADRFARDWALEQKTKFSIEYKQFDADWTKHGKAAGPIRNKAMAYYANILIAFWDGKSRGTRSMINEALKAGLEVHVFRYGD